MIEIGSLVYAVFLDENGIPCWQMITVTSLTGDTVTGLKYPSLELRCTNPRNEVYTNEVDAVVAMHELEIKCGMLTFVDNT